MPLVSNEKAPVTAMSVSMRAEIELYGRGCYKGKLYSQYLETPYEFFTLIRMIEKMEEIFDEKKFPQAFLTPRTFEEKKGKAKKRKRAESDVVDLPDLAEYENPSKGYCTFEIMVRFRQNASWQGQVIWEEKNLKQNFRSEIELFRLMDDAITEIEEDDEDDEDVWGS